MNKLKQNLLNLKSSILKSLEELDREKSAIEKCMLRRHEPPKVENAPLLAVKRKINRNHNNLIL